MTDIECLELVLRRVYADLDRTPRSGASDELHVLKRILEELMQENINATEAKKESKIHRSD